MNFLGFTVGRTKTLMNVPVQGSSWWWPIRESFTGAWQRNVTVESTQNLLAFSAVFACISLISDDISKLRIKLLQQLDNGIWQEIAGASPFWGVLRKPNDYQTRVQFIALWLVTKLLYGNAYIIKERDQRGVVVKMYVLNPRLVKPLITETGDVYYQLLTDYLSGIAESVTIPASEIIHDRMLCLWHPLVGVSPIVACATSGTQGLRIQANSAKFFENMSRPSGVLTAPGAISDPTALRLKEDFERNFSGSNIGRLLVAGDGLKYEALTMPAQVSQLIEQLRWTVEDVARAFKIPLYKLGLAAPPASSIPVLNQDYYSQTLQVYIESIEILLDEGIGLPALGYGTELDLDGLLRMDPISRADKYAKEIGAGMLAPNEARFSENLQPAEGGDSPYMQQQNYSLSALAKRDSQPDPFGKTSPPPALPVPAPTVPVKSVESNLVEWIMKKMKAEYVRQ